MRKLISVMVLIFSLSITHLSIAQENNKNAEFANAQKIYQEQSLAISLTYAAKSKTILAEYAKELDTLEQVIAKKADLKGVMAVRQEEADVKLANGIPDNVTDQTPVELKALKEKYKGIMATVESDKKKDLAKLATLYIGRLKTIQDTLTKNLKIDDALVVNNEIAQVKGSIDLKTNEIVGASSQMTPQSAVKPEEKKPASPPANALVAGEGKTIVTVNSSIAGKKSPLEDALVVICDAGLNSTVALGPTGQDGKVQLDVNAKTRYDLIAFHKEYKFLREKNIRFSKPLELTMYPLPKGQLMGVVDRSGLSIFDEAEKDIQIGTTYGEHTSCDFRCMNNECLIGYDRPTLTIIERCSPGQSFFMKKGKRRAKCDVLCSLPSGFVIQYKVSP
ncbi:MAG: hypothetical protein PHI84_02200 [Kiritimatiellae bacterium]|nr:hypothetical protein [Kiritimatiellia bacterium]